MRMLLRDRVGLANTTHYHFISAVSSCPIATSASSTTCPSAKQTLPTKCFGSCQLNFTAGACTMQASRNSTVLSGRFTLVTLYPANPSNGQAFVVGPLLGAPFALKL